MTPMVQYLAGAPRGFAAMLRRHAKWNGIDWTRGSEDGFRDDSRKPTNDLADAEVISSAIAPATAVLDEMSLHEIALDIDRVAYLIPSSTPGHFHLYIEHTVRWRDYAELLQLLAKMGVIESGFASASITRKATFLRLPWVKKHREKFAALNSPEALEEWLQQKEVAS